MSYFLSHVFALSLLLVMLFQGMQTASSFAFERSEETWQEGEIHLSSIYQEAQSGQRVREDRQVQLKNLQVSPINGTLVNQNQILKTIFLVSMVEKVRLLLKDFEKSCKERPLVFPVPRVVLSPDLPPSALCPQVGKVMVQRLNADIIQFSQQLDQQTAILGEQKVYEFVDYLRLLSKNMPEGKLAPSFSDAPHPLPGPPRANAPGGARARHLNVTTGGAQDYESFKQTIKKGFVPYQENLPIEGFLSEFDLSLPDQRCEKLLCLYPSLALVNDDSNQKKLYLQLHMNSSLTRETLIRRPLNLSVVLDISGSMGATDLTEKSRLEWAKETLIKVIGKLTDKDSLSIVLFDTNSETLIPPTPISDEEKEKIIAKIKPLQPRGSTNLYQGLRDGFQHVSLNFKEGYENRVILISDAGLNTGVISDAELLRLISNYAGEGIGLSAIGLGLNFNQDFIHHLSMARGGNYVFMHSGERLFKLMENFDYFVTPVAYDFKVKLEFKNLQVQLVKAYGVPDPQGAGSVSEVIDVRTLFFSEEGGAILLEYNLL